MTAAFFLTLPLNAFAQQALADLTGNGSVLLQSPAGEIVFSLNADMPLVPASLLKIPLAQAALTALEGTNISFRIDTRTGELTVPDVEYHEARMFLAGQNIPRESNLGSLDTLLEQGSMTTSRFMEQVSYRAAMEKELSLIHI